MVRTHSPAWTYRNESWFYPQDYPQISNFQKTCDNEQGGTNAMKTQFKRPTFRMVEEDGRRHFRLMESDGTIGEGTIIVEHGKRRPETYCCQQCGADLLTIHYPIEIHIGKIRCLRCEDQQKRPEP